MTRYAQLGAVVDLLNGCNRRSYHISALEYWIKPAIELEQIRVFFDDTSGLPVAYITWAYLGDDVSKRMSIDSVNALHFSEWNEGLNLWILDFVAPYGHAREVIRFIKKNMFQHHCLARAVRRDGNDVMKRLCVLKRPASRINEK
jgi:cytolysin-activating lysine-acyltransferase